MPAAPKPAPDPNGPVGAPHDTSDPRTTVSTVIVSPAVQAEAKAAGIATIDGSAVTGTLPGPGTSFTGRIETYNLRAEAGNSYGVAAGTLVTVEHCIETGAVRRKV